MLGGIAIWGSYFLIKKCINSSLITQKGVVVGIDTYDFYESTGRLGQHIRTYRGYCPIVAFTGPLKNRRETRNGSQEMRSKPEFDTSEAQQSLHFEMDDHGLPIPPDTGYIYLTRVTKDCYLPDRYKIGDSLEVGYFKGDILNAKVVTESKYWLPARDKYVWALCAIWAFIVCGRADRRDRLAGRNQ